MEELWKLILKLCYIDEDNDIEKTWKERSKEKNERGSKLDSYHFTKLHYTASNGTNLTVGMMAEGRFRGGADTSLSGVTFNPNIPSEEVFISPRRGEAEGVFRAGLEALDVHMLISSFCFYRVSNRYTVSRIFRTDLHDAEVRQRHRRMIGEAVLRYIRA